MVSKNYILRIFLLTQLLLLFIFTYCGIASASSHQEPFKLGFFVAIDPSHQWTINDIQKRSFEYTDSNSISLGFRSDSVWLKSVLPHSGTVEDLLVHLNYIDARYFDVYLIDQSGEVTSYQYGTASGLDLRPIKISDFVVPIPKEAQWPVELYVRIQTYSALALSANVYETSNYFETLLINQAVVWSLLGGLLLLASYNLFLYFSIKSIEYLYYTLYVLSFFSMQCVLGGIGYQYLWPKTPILTAQLTVVSLSAVVFTATLFARQFLNTKKLTPRIHEVTLILPASAVGLCFFPFIVSPAVYVSWMPSYANVFVVAIISLGLYHLYLGNNRAKVFVLAWSCFVIGGVFTIGTYQGYIPTNFYTLNASKFGGLLEALFLALALANKVNSAQRDKAEAEKKANVALQQKNSALKEAYQLKNRFMATMSHELRTPLNGVTGALELMRENHQGMSMENMSDLIETAEDSGDHLEFLVNQILEYTDLSSGQYQINENTIDLGKWRQEIYNFWVTIVNEKELKLFISNLDKPYYVKSDREIITKIANQLLDNAVKFTDDGSIEFNCDLVQESTRTILVIEIKDTGKGIPLDELDWLTQGFSQHEQGSKRSHGGLGIGLALCKSWSSALNGNISIDSNANYGTQVRVELPVILCGQSSLAANVPVPENNHARYNRILVVEDNPTNQTILVRIIEKLGYETCVSDNGSAAVEYLANNSDVDMIFMDCEMPVMDGYQATDIIRHQIFNGQELPIIAVTANAMSSDRKKCIDAGMSDYITKPVKIERVKLVIERWVSTTQKSR